MNNNLTISEDKIKRFCREYGIRKLSLFGSALRPDFGVESDVDILAEFQPGHTPGYFSLLDMEVELTDIFRGHKADLRTPEELSKYFREEVIANAKVLYVQR